MRRFFLAAAMFGAVTGAQAADMPDFLRGTLPASSEPTRNWEGWYAGGQVGYSSAAMDFSQSVVGLTNFIYRNSVLQEPTSQWSLLNKANTQATGFGAFVGRNYQWDDIVLGVEANYSYINGLAASSSSSISRGIVNPAGDNPPTGHTHTYNVTLTGAAEAQVKDVITFRGRAGWASGNFLPYVFGGLAVGRMDVARSVTSSGNLQDDYDVTTTTVIGTTTINNTVHHTDFSQLQTLSQAQQRTNNFVAGWTAGLGMEYMLWGNIFMRGEWEYVKFLSVENTKVTMNSLHAGLGYKF
jgi:opacity protein-like surface antigen